MTWMGQERSRTFQKDRFLGFILKRSFPLYFQLYIYITRSGAGEYPSPARRLRFLVWNSRSGLHWYLLFAHPLRFFLLSSSPARSSCLRSMVHPVSSFGIHLQSPVRCFNPSFIFCLNIFFHVYIASLQLECFTSLPLPCDKWAVSPRPSSV